MNLLQNFKFAIRLLLKSPGLVAVAALSVGLGIGVNTAMFSVLHAALFKTPQVEAPEELVNVYTRREGSNAFSTSSVADWADLRSQSTALEGLVGHSWALINVELDGQPRLEVGSVVTDGYFETLGIQAVHGRRFLPEEQRPGAVPVVMLTHRFWKRAFDSRPSVVGDTVRIGGTEFLVTGVLPPGFNGLLRGLEAELFVPAAQLSLVEPAGEITTQGRRSAGLDTYSWRGYRFLTLTGRLADGSTVEGVNAEVATIMSNLAAEHGESNDDLTAVALPTSKVLVNPSVDGTLLPAAILLLVMVGLVLLVASANLANLLLARAVARRREIGVRLALGATKRQLVQQLLVESSLLAAVGAASGLFLAVVVLQFLSAGQLDLPISPSLDLELSRPVLFFALGLTALTALICGVIPALQASRTNLIPALKSEAGSGHAEDAKRWWRPSLGSALVIGQVAMSLILVVGASLLTRSVGAARDVDLGFDADPVGVLTLDLDPLNLEREEATERLRQLASEVRAVPGIEAVGITTRMPLGLNMVNASFFIEGVRETMDDPPLDLEITYANPGYFEVMGSTLLEGRLFDSRDRRDSPRVAVVTAAMNQRFWPGESAVGKVFRVNQPDAAPVEVVGVIRDLKIITPGEDPRPFVHLSWDQSGGEYALIAYKSQGPAGDVLEAAYGRIREVEPGVFVADSTTLKRMRDTMLLPVRAGGAVFGVMGALALLLSGTGLAGLIAYRVGQRTREIGLRMALGANEALIMRGVVLQSMAFVGWGSAVGLFGAFALGKALETILYVPAWDPLSIVLGVGTLTLVAIGASVVPARRAAAVDPLVALRQS